MDSAAGTGALALSRGPPDGAAPRLAVALQRRLDLRRQPFRQPPACLGDEGGGIVGWVGRSRRDAAERLHQVLAGSGAPLLGVIANGSKPGGAGSYAYARDDKSSPAVASANGAGPSERVPAARA